jgi:hypothetical protein
VQPHQLGLREAKPVHLAVHDRVGGLPAPIAHLQRRGKEVQAASVPRRDSASAARRRAEDAT